MEIRENNFFEKEVLSNRYSSKIGGIDVAIEFPSYQETLLKDNLPLSDPNLKPPEVYGRFQDKEELVTINWGEIYSTENEIVGVDYLLINLRQKNMHNINKIYKEFPRWKEKFYRLFKLVKGYKYYIEEQSNVSLLQGSGTKYDGLEMFHCYKNQLYSDLNNDSFKITFSIPQKAKCLSVDEITSIFKKCGSDSSITLEDELLITAYESIERGDYRSAVLFSAVALEITLNSLIKDPKKPKFLGGKLYYLNDQGFEIPIKDYELSSHEKQSSKEPFQRLILDIRNAVAHEGKNVTFEEGLLFIERCRYIIDFYRKDDII